MSKILQKYDIYAKTLQINKKYVRIKIHKIKPTVELIREIWYNKL